MNYLECHNILTTTQFGFRQKHSCESQLLLTTDDFARFLDSNTQVDVGILDLSKAFDKVPHKRLTIKLDYYGIRGNLLTWIQSFLENRTQLVVVEGHYSSLTTVTLDVPQGTVLGPTLFLLYINDISADILSQLRLFADDCLICRPIYSNEDHERLQRDLNSLTQWASIWQMEFNVAKCNILQISNHHNISQFNYTMQGVQLTTVKQHHYLGILLDQKLSWHPHIDQICNRANRLLGLLKRNLPKNNNCQTIREHSYKQLILPMLSYCAMIWDPHHQNTINKIEMIQHRATPFVLNCPWQRHHHYYHYDSVTLMLQKLQWPTLQSLRTNARFTLLYKIIHHYQQIPDNYQPIPAYPITRANHHSKFLHYSSRTNTYCYSFFPRTIPEWNSPPSNITEADDLTTFKYNLTNKHLSLEVHR